jgi:hypothetical protein
MASPSESFKPSFASASLQLTILIHENNGFIIPLSADFATFFVQLFNASGLKPIFFFLASSGTVRMFSNARKTSLNCRDLNPTKSEFQLKMDENQKGNKQEKALLKSKGRDKL